MRHVLPTYPFTRAIRYGPVLAGHWNVFVSGAHGLKHSGLTPGVFEIFGPAARAALLAMASVAATAAQTSVVANFGIVILQVCGFPPLIVRFF
jgi:hypothetical protein